MKICKIGPIIKNAKKKDSEKINFLYKFKYFFIGIIFSNEDFFIFMKLKKGITKIRFFKLNMSFDAKVNLNT